MLGEPDNGSYKAFDLKTKVAVAMLGVTEWSIVAPMDAFINYFFSWYRLKVVTAVLLQFKTYLMNRMRGEDTEKHMPIARFISVEELQIAEKELIKYVQRKGFPEWFTGRGSVKKSNALCHLNPLIIDGVMRVGGRLRKANLPFESKHPAILPAKDHLTDLIIQDNHARLAGHLSVNATLNNFMKCY